LKKRDAMCFFENCFLKKRAGETERERRVFVFFFLSFV